MSTPDEFAAESRRQPPQRVEISMPEGLVPGVPADIVGVWHTADTFVLDFSAFVDPPQLLEEEGQEIVHQRAQVVARVRVPPGQVFEIMKALEQQLSAWERENES